MIFQGAEERAGRSLVKEKRGGGSDRTAPEFSYDILRC